MTHLPVARINDVALHEASEVLGPEELRQRACTELLRQEAQRLALLPVSDPPARDGIVSEAASAAIAALLDREVRVPAPEEEACRRHFAANARSFGSGERARLRHILFAVTPGVDVAALRQRAEATLLDVRAGEPFAEAARTLSNCPTGAKGGDLGWVGTGDCVPEFARPVFAHAGCGVLPRLVQTRHGFHVVEVVERDAGTTPDFEMVKGAVARTLERRAFVTALVQYLRLLAGAARVEGVDLEGAATPLVQ